MSVKYEVMGAARTVKTLASSLAVLWSNLNSVARHFVIMMHRADRDGPGPRGSIIGIAHYSLLALNAQF